MQRYYEAMRGHDWPRSGARAYQLYWNGRNGLSMKVSGVVPMSLGHAAWAAGQDDRAVHPTGCIASL